MRSEFPHEAIMLEQKNVPDGAGGSKKSWVPIGEPFECFVDTPSTDRIVEANKRNITVHRDLYVEDASVLNTKYRVRYQTTDYELNGDIESQGGLDEVFRVALKKVT